jgi:hypothetical protein
VSAGAARGRKYVPSLQPTARTIAQRTSITPRNSSTKTVIMRSTERMNTVRPRSTLATLQGISSRHSTASSVPAALARSELSKSPRTNRAKLVVMPQEGQGIFVMV